MTANRYGDTFGGDANVLGLVVVMAAHQCEYTENHWIIHLKKSQLPKIKSKTKQTNRETDPSNGRKSKHTKLHRISRQVFKKLFHKKASIQMVS